MQVSDVLSVRLLHTSIKTGTCLWRGARVRPCWSLLVTLAACTAFDSAASIALTMFDAALLASRKMGVRVLHVGIHCLSLTAEAGIAAATCLLLVHTGTHSAGSKGGAELDDPASHLGGSYEATMAFFGVLFQLRRVPASLPGHSSVAVCAMMVHVAIFQCGLLSLMRVPHPSEIGVLINTLVHRACQLVRAQQHACRSLIAHHSNLVCLGNTDNLRGSSEAVAASRAASRACAAMARAL